MTTSAKISIHPIQANPLEVVSNYFFGLPKKKFPFQKSIAGSTGVTFLPLGYNFKWVVKWQNPSLTEAEYLCTVFYKRAFVHLSVPQAICVLSDELINKIREVFKGQNISDTYIPMLLEYKDGNTLNKLFEFEHILKLSPEEREKLFVRVGEIAGYDFLIANFDRLVPAGFKDTVDEKHSVNGGNLIVELKVPPTSEEWESEGSVSSIHVIDNAPHPILFFAPDERRIKELSDDDMDLEGGMFYLEDEFEVPSEKIEPQEVADSNLGSRLREKRHQDFLNFIQRDSEGIRVLAKQICIGIKNEWNRIIKEKKLTVPNFIEDTQEAMEESLAQGLLLAQVNLKELPLQQVLDELRAENNTVTEAAKIVFDFIQKNLIFTQN